MVALLITNVLLSFYGLYRAYSKKHMVLFMWIILLYFSIGTIICIYGEGQIYSFDSKMKFVSNMTFCLCGFLASDFLFNKKAQRHVSWDFLSLRDTQTPLLIVEIVYWLSLIGTFAELRLQDYNTYNTGVGAGWFQIFFQSFSCIIFLFIYRRQWIKVIIASIFIIAIIAVVGVRSLLYFTLMPVLLWGTYSLLFSNFTKGQMIKRLLGASILVVIVIYIVNMLRFGQFSLPDSDLTAIGLNVMDSTNYPLSYINSILHYFAPLFNPVVNAFNLLGAGITLPTDMLLPSVPRLNAVVQAHVKDVEFLQNASHMPATIYFDFLACWSDFAGVAAFVVYIYFLKIWELIQNNAVLFFSFSGIVGWHFYMLLRGAVDTCTGGLSYSIWICLFLYLFMRRRLKNENPINQ